MFLPIRLLADRWPTPLERLLARFVWADPSCILEPDCTSSEFRRAMSAVHVGGTIKITRADRHPEVDDLLSTHLDLTGVRIADIGASDGSTSLDLITRLPTFGSFVIADRYLHLGATRVGRRTVLTDEEGKPILVIGRRLLAWPSISPVVSALTRPVTRAAARHPHLRQDVLLLNPAVRELLRTDERVSYRTHDVFTPWSGDPLDVIKVANLLRRLYFPDEQITRALGALHASLPIGGHLLIVDNPRVPEGGARGGLYRRTAEGFETVAVQPDEPEIHDLVTTFTTGSGPAAQKAGSACTQSPSEEASVA